MACVFFDEELLEIQRILLQTWRKETERDAFFLRWLRDHLKHQGRDEKIHIKSVSAYLVSLPDEERIVEMKVIKEEYFWCKRTPIEIIRRLANE